MNEERAIPSAAAAPDDPTEDWPGGRAPSPCGQAQIAMLDELADLAMSYAREAAALGLSRIEAARRQAAAREPANSGEPPVSDPALDDPGLYDPTPEQDRFERMARTVRMILGLRARLLLDLAAWEKRVADTAAALEQRLAEDRGKRRAALKGKASIIVAEVVEKTFGNAAAIDSILPVSRWFDERQEFAGLFDRPIGEVVAMICRDLGRPIDWRLWQKRPWGAAAMAAAAAAPAPAPDRPEPPDTTSPAATDPAARDTTPTRAEPAAPPEAAAPADAKPGEPVAPQGGLCGTGTDPPPDRSAFRSRSHPAIAAWLAARMREQAGS